MCNAGINMEIIMITQAHYTPVQITSNNPNETSMCSLLCCTFVTLMGPFFIMSHYSRPKSPVMPLKGNVDDPGFVTEADLMPRTASQSSHYPMSQCQAIGHCYLILSTYKSCGGLNREWSSLYRGHRVSSTYGQLIILKLDT